MLTNSKDLKGLVIRATDGELGTVEEVYFEDDKWAVRYLTVETGDWLAGRSVLISPYSIRGTDWQARRLDVALTKSQVRDSPNVSTHAPISREHESTYLSYYGYPYYWDGPDMWGQAQLPHQAAMAATASAEAMAKRIRDESQDSFLRSTAGTIGYHIDASDGEIGHVAGFVVDDEAWAIRYVEVSTQNWWPGKRVLISPGWIERISWREEKVYVPLLRDAIQSAPEYVASQPISREYEHRLHLHYGRPPYWVHAPREESLDLAPSLTSIA